MPLMSLSEARDILDRMLRNGRLNTEELEAIRTASTVLDDVMHADVAKYLDEPEDVKTVIHLSGGDVTQVDKPDDVEVEVRQYHHQFFADREVHTDEAWPGCTYEIEWPPPTKRKKKKP